MKKTPFTPSRSPRRNGSRSPLRHSTSLPLPNESPSTTIEHLNSATGSRIAQLKAQLQQSIISSSDHNKSKYWEGKDWEDSDSFGDLTEEDDEDEDNDTGDNKKKKKRNLRQTQSFQQSFKYWNNLVEDDDIPVVPEDLRQKDETLGKTKTGVSKHKLAGLKGLLKNAVIDTMADQHHHDNKNNDAKSNAKSLLAGALLGKGNNQNNNEKGNLLLNLMVSASQEKVQHHMEATGRGAMFKLKTKVEQRRMERAAIVLQKFFRDALYVTKKYRIKRRHYKRDLQDVKRRQREELQDITNWVQAECQQWKLQLYQQYANITREQKQQIKELSREMSGLRREIEQEKQSHQTMETESHQLERQNELVDLKRDNKQHELQAETMRLEHQIEQLQKDADDWKKLEKFYQDTIAETNAKMEAITENFYQERTGRKKMVKLVGKIVKRTMSAVDDEDPPPKWAQRVQKLKQKRDAKFQQLKEARRDGEYRVEDEDDMETTLALLKERKQSIIANVQEVTSQQKIAAVSRRSSLPAPVHTKVPQPKRTSLPQNSGPSNQTQTNNSKPPPPPRLPSLSEKPTGKAQDDFVSGRKETFDDLYTIGEKLGAGEFGAVYHCRHKKNGSERAVKILLKEHMDQWEYDQVLLEFQLLTNIDNPNVIRVYEFYDTDEKFYIVQELAKGGELFDELLANGRLSEQDVATLIRSVLSCVRDLAARGIVHRDINLENILLEKPGNYDSLKLIDFGLAVKCKEGERLYEMAGKARYLAPEILGDRGYGLKADVWSVGVAAYTLLAGFHPFEAEYDMDVYPLIEEGYYDFKDKVWDNVSEQAKEMVSKLLTYKEEERPSAEEALALPLFTANNTGITFSPDRPVVEMWTSTPKKAPSPVSREENGGNGYIIPSYLESKQNAKTKKSVNFAGEKKSVNFAEDNEASISQFNIENDTTTNNNSSTRMALSVSDLKGSSDHSKASNNRMWLSVADLSTLENKGKGKKSKLSKKQEKKQRKLEKERQEEEMLAEILRKREARGNKVVGESAFNSMLFSTINQGTKKTSETIGKSKLKGAALLKGAVKDVMGRQFRATTLQALVKAGKEKDDEGTD